MYDLMMFMVLVGSIIYSKVYGKPVESKKPICAPMEQKCMIFVTGSTSEHVQQLAIQQYNGSCHKMTTIPYNCDI
jgi:hypothetical protein